LSGEEHENDDEWERRANVGALMLLALIKSVTAPAT
jgi:hypothetical protein